MAKMQGLREIRVVTEWKDGCVWKTKHQGYAWITFGKDTSSNPNIHIGSVSTSVTQNLRDTTRTVTDTAPDMVPVKLDELLKR
jgi:hypothetical protein